MYSLLVVWLALLPVTGYAVEQPSADAVIDAFYRDYLASEGPAKEPPPLSKAFKAAMAENAAICKTHAGSNVCGFGADGDPYLDAQEYKVTYKTSGISVAETTPSMVRVMLNVYPSVKKSKGAYERTILYKMKLEDGMWVVDDILYAGGASARKLIKTEIDYYRNQSASNAAGN